MKAQELRIGNLVMFREKKVVEVSNLGNSFETIELANGLRYGSDDIEDYEPIPLIEEWLLKMGFEYSRDEFLFNNGYFDLIFNDNKVSLRVEGQWLSLEIKHVHQLQNLYFALTGCELEIK